MIFDRIPNEKILHLESHRSAILFWRSVCYPATGPKFCAILVTNYWAQIYINYIPTDLQCNDVHPGNCGKLYAKYWKMTDPHRLSCVALISDIASCIFSPLTLCMRNVFKWQYLVVVGAKPFPANQNVKYECFHWASKYSILLAGGVYQGIWFALCCSVVVVWCLSILPIFYDDVIKWKHFPHYWPFVRGIFTGHRWIPRTKASGAELWCFLWSLPE